MKDVHSFLCSGGGGKKKGKEDKSHKPLTFPVGTGKVIRGVSKYLI